MVMDATGWCWEIVKIFLKSRLFRVLPGDAVKVGARRNYPETGRATRMRVVIL
jgi:hypothetical protein